VRGEIFFIVLQIYSFISLKHRLLVNVFLAASFNSKLEPLSGHFSGSCNVVYALD
jgi:hypothetical protein